MDVISLEQYPVEVLVDAFNNAFQNYAVDVAMTPERLTTMTMTRSVRLDHSWALVDAETILAFVLNGSRVVDGVLTAYDSGTGVRLDYQRQGLGQQLLSSVIENLSALGYGRYVLEVLESNTAAIKTYERHGFAVVRTLSCYEAEREALVVENTKVNAIPASPKVTRSLSALLTHTPSWQNASESIDEMPDPCTAIVAEDDHGPACFAMLAPSSGSIMQFGCRRDSSDKVDAVLGCAALLSDSRVLRALNIDTDDHWTNELLQGSGFRRFVAQYEMERLL